jgi:REP-associated tyrosine transposase
MTLPHRKRKATYNEPGHAHFLTYSCFRRLPLLSRDRTRQWVIEALDAARQRLDFALWAYVIMPEHIHLLIHPRQTTYRMAHILAALKRPVSVQAKGYLQEGGHTEWLRRLTVSERGRNVFRFWQAGSGYDENLWNDRPIRAVIDYIHANPVRRGLVESPTDWYWSSARVYAGLDKGPFVVDPLTDL